MIILHINPAKVEKVVFESSSEIEEDFDFAAWQAIRPFVNRIDRTLKEISQIIITKDLVHQIIEGYKDHAGENVNT